MRITAETPLQMPQNSSSATSIRSLVRMYHDKLSQILSTLQKIQTSLTQDEVVRTRNLFKDLSGQLEDQSWWTLGFSVVGGAGVISSVAMPNEGLQKLAENIGNVLFRATDFVGKYKESKQQLVSGELQLAQNHFLPQLTKMKETFSGLTQQLEHTISDIQRTEAQGFQSV